MQLFLIFASRQFHFRFRFSFSASRSLSLLHCPQGKHHLIPSFFLFFILITLKILLFRSFFLIIFQIVQHRPHGLALWAPFQQCLCNCGGDSKPALFPGYQSICHHCHPASLPSVEGFILIDVPVPSDGGLPRVCTGRGYLPRPIVAHILSLDQPAHLVSQGGVIFANMVIVIMKTMISTSHRVLGSPPLNNAIPYNTRFTTCGVYLCPLGRIWLFFTPQSPRLATSEQIFGTPWYDGLFIDQSLVMNRRRDGMRKV